MFHVKSVCGRERREGEGIFGVGGYLRYRSTMQCKEVGCHRYHRYRSEIHQIKSVHISAESCHMGITDMVVLCCARNWVSQIP